jgi:RHS repeat-associated protein
VSWNIVLGDIRGSTAVTIARGTSTIISQWWTPYGERRGTRNDPIGTRGYLNQPEDSASGLSYLNHRYLDPRLGIFISVDPLITTTNEPYLYAAGNPTTLSDPEGLCAGREGSRGGCGIDYFGGGGVDVNGGTGGAMRCGQGRHGLQGGACNSYGRTIDGDTWSTAANVAPRAGGPRIADGYWRPTPAAHRSGSCSWTCFTFAVSLAPVAGDAIDAFDCLNGSAVSCGVLPIPFLSGRVATGIDAMVQARRATKAGELPGLSASRAQLEAKFKHAADFGVVEGRGASGFDAFGKAVDSFVADSGTVRVVGTYRGSPAILNYNPATAQVVVQATDGTFVSGWQMSPAQLQNVITNGSLGGG